MIRRLATCAIVLAMIVVGLGLCLDLMYLVRGSLEEFPTEEQEDKVRRVTAVGAALLLVMEIVLWSFLRQVQRSTVEPNTGVR